MRKIGKPINPILLVFLTIATFSVVGFIWIIDIIGEIRDYRRKGVSPWFILILLLLDLFVVFAEGMTFNEYLTIINVLFFVYWMYLSFHIPYLIEQEISKLESQKSHWYRLCVIQIIIFVVYLIAVALKLSYPSILYSNPFYPDFPVLVMELMFIGIWIFQTQRRLNQLWHLANDTETFAIPELVNSESSDTISADKEESDE